MTGQSPPPEPVKRYRVLVRQADGSLEFEEVELTEAAALAVANGLPLEDAKRGAVDGFNWFRLWRRVR